MTFQLTSTDELVERGTFEELRRFLTNLLDRRGHSAAATRVSWWDEDTPPTPDIRGAFWSVVAGGTLYEIHNQHARMSWLDPGVIGPGVPVTHVLTLDDVEIHRGSFAACALTMSSRFTGHSLEVLARLDPTAAELADWDDRHGDPMKAPWLERFAGAGERRLTDDEWSDLRRFRNCAKFAERLEEPGADAQVVSLALEAGGMTYRLSPIGDEQ